METWHTRHDVNMYQPWNLGIFAISTKAVGFRVVSGEVKCYTKGHRWMIIGPCQKSSDDVN